MREDRRAGTPGRNLDSFAEQVAEALAPELRLLRPLGESPVSRVFLAREPALRRLVAVKVLSPDLRADETAQRRFEREAQSAARIAHPNVVTVYRVGRLESGLPYLVMRYVKGRSLAAELAAEGPVSMPRACAVLGDVTSAVAAGHRKRVVHRDIKPANILVDGATDEVFVADFGIAAIVASGEEEPERITAIGHLVGDPQYMSPERLLGEAVGERADVYNIGILGYELLAGRGPFTASSNREWTEAHLTREPPPVTEFEPRVDARLSDFLLRCLSKNPLHRPDAADAEAAVREMCGHAPARAPRDGVGVLRAAGGRAAASPMAEDSAVSVAPARPTDAPPGTLGPDGQELRFDVLGDTDLEKSDGGRVLSVVAQPKRLALLTYLAVNADAPFKRRDRVVSVFWPEHEDDRARHSLRQALYVLRGSLGSEALVSRGDDEIGVDPDVLWCDAVAFERALKADRPDVAMELYRGPLLPGFYLTDVIEFEHWLDNERNRLERLATEAAWKLATRSERSGDAATALHWGRRAMEFSPFEESLLRRLIELQLRLGDRAGALNVYDTFARRLREELEAEPTEQTLELIERVRSG
ncbi:MAG: protein kinase domain-containing protein [Gemmatimonadota bacterium]